MNIYTTQQSFNDVKTQVYLSVHVIVITRSRDDYGKYNLECALAHIFPVSIACECYNELITR